MKRVILIVLCIISTSVYAMVPAAIGVAGALGGTALGALLTPDPSVETNTTAQTATNTSANHTLSNQTQTNNPQTTQTAQQTLSPVFSPKVQLAPTNNNTFSPQNNFYFNTDAPQTPVATYGAPVMNCSETIDNQVTQKTHAPMTSSIETSAHPVQENTLEQRIRPEQTVTTHIPTNLIKKIAPFAILVGCAAVIWANINAKKQEEYLHHPDRWINFQRSIPTELLSTMAPLQVGSLLLSHKRAPVSDTVDNLISPLDKISYQLAQEEKQLDSFLTTISWLERFHVLSLSMINSSSIVHAIDSKTRIGLLKQGCSALKAHYINETSNHQSLALQSAVEIPVCP